MKPSIGRAVYIPYRNAMISKETVLAVGKDGFLIGSILNTELVESYRTRLFLYEDYNVTWFTSLSAAKKAVIHSYGEKDIVLVEKMNDYWEVASKECIE